MVLLKIIVFSGKKLTYILLLSKGKSCVSLRAQSDPWKILEKQTVMPILLPNFNFWDSADCSSQERIMFNAWINTEIIYGSAPQYIIKVKPRFLPSSTALGKFLLVVVIDLECFGVKQLPYPLSQAVNNVSDFLSCHLPQINRRNFHCL